MAKIRPARPGGRKSPVGPKAPGAIGCIFVLVSVFLLVMGLLYVSIVRGH
jgi:hypothetical protein